VKRQDKFKRLALLKRRSAALKKAEAMREYWKRRRPADQSSDSDEDHAGSPDGELADLLGSD
jgi:hypothetical protein